jgi:hypothetical protein
MSTVSRIARALRRYGLTVRLVAVLGIVVVAGAAAVSSALLGRSATATALIAVLVTVAVAGLVETRRRSAVTDRGMRDLRVMVEQTQRRLMVAAEHERVAAADRHQVLSAEISALRGLLGERAGADDPQDTPVATIPIPTSLRNL